MQTSNELQSKEEILEIQNCVCINKTNISYLYFTANGCKYSWDIQAVLSLGNIRFKDRNGQGPGFQLIYSDQTKTDYILGSIAINNFLIHITKCLEQLILQQDHD